MDVIGNMIASITFTYGEDRTELYKFKSKDSFDKLFRSSLDYNLYVFHNSSDEFVNNIKNSELFSGYKFSYCSVTGSYPAALKQILLFLQKKGITKIVFLQDDVFNLVKDEKCIFDLVDLLKTTNYDYLNLEYAAYEFENKIKRKQIIQKRDTFNIYNTDTLFFKTATTWSWSFDDSPYYSTLEYALNTIYDEVYFSYSDIWSAEWYLKSKFDHFNIPRFITDKKFFRRVSLLGKHNNYEKELVFLKDTFY